MSMLVRAPLSWNERRDVEASGAVIRIMSSSTLVGASRRKPREPPLMVRPATESVPAWVAPRRPGRMEPELRTTCAPIEPLPASAPPATVTTPEPVAEPPTPTPVLAATRVPWLTVVPPT